MRFKKIIRYTHGRSRDIYGAPDLRAALPNRSIYTHGRSRDIYGAWGWG